MLVGPLDFSVHGFQIIMRLGWRSKINRYFVPVGGNGLIEVVSFSYTTNSLVIENI